MKDETYTLESSNILYTSISYKYIDDYLTMVNDLDVQKFITKDVKLFSYDDEVEWIKNKLKDKAIIFTMLEKKSNKFIGNIELKDYTGSSAEIGISITSKMQNKHYGLEAMKTMIDYGFNKLLLKEITLVVFSSNARAIHCYKKLGFVEYKVIKDVAVIDEQKVDDIYMRIVR